MELFEQIKSNPFIISGPCVIESEAMVLDLAERLKKIADSMGLIYIFKASFDKANRTSVDSFRGLGFEEGLRILEKVRKEIGVYVLTDIHESSQAKPVAEVVDILQIPAFLCRQTDLLVESGKTGKIINIKKAQFLSGNDMIYPCQKVASTGNNKIMLTERGNMYGNNDLVVDFRNILQMQKHGFPVIMDITHSVQKPNAAGGKSGGNSEYAPYFAFAAASMGIRGFFFETHHTPEKALSDGANMIKFADVPAFLNKLMKFFIA
ncbi:MAG: 3-deoxy-8-phosphooctulonate synthase [Bacteroidetes bacterium]|nr:MAG: 3-deoxy-8-phosphooctulonate synthase [Bacteroidota bacterium]